MEGFDKKRQRLTLPHITAVPSALVGLTSLFGMGRGDPHRHSHLKALKDYQQNRFPDSVTLINIVDMVVKRVEH